MKISLLGKMAAGKDTVANYLVENYDFVKVPIGKNIYTVGQLIWPKEFAEAKGKPRKMLQHIGEHMREYDQDCWVKSVIRTGTFIEGRNIVVSDNRQANEAEFLRKHGFAIVKIIADETIRMDRLTALYGEFDKETFYHPNELRVDEVKFDYLIDNNSNFDSLFEQVRKILTSIKDGADASK